MILLSPKFPKDDDFDYNPEIDQMIEDRLFSYQEKEEDIKDIYPSSEVEYGSNDLEDVL